jgi:hypothetical protein
MVPTEANETCCGELPPESYVGILERTGLLGTFVDHCDGKLKQCQSLLCQPTMTRTI